MSIEDQARAAATGAHAAQPQQAPPPVPGRHAWVPRWFVTVLHAGESAVSHLRPVAMSPEVDQLIETALRADGLGVEATVFHAAIDLINGGADRKQQGSGPQPAFLPAPAADGSEAT